MRMLLRTWRHSSRLALLSIRADSPPWLGAPITMVPAPILVAYSDQPPGGAVIRGMQDLAFGRDA